MLFPYRVQGTRLRRADAAGASLAHSRSRRPSANSRRRVAAPHRRVQVSRQLGEKGCWARPEGSKNPKP